MSRTMTEEEAQREVQRVIEAVTGETEAVRKTQSAKILEYIKQNGSITQIEATMHIGCTRLAARIADMRKAGIAIRSDRVKVRRYDGTMAMVARYSLAEE